MIPDRHNPVDVDAVLALLKIGETAKSFADQLIDMQLRWTETYDPIKKIPKTVSTLSLRTRLSEVDGRLSAAWSVLESICNSCRAVSLSARQVAALCREYGKRQARAVFAGGRPLTPHHEGETMSDKDGGEARPWCEPRAPHITELAQHLWTCGICVPDPQDMNTFLQTCATGHRLTRYLRSEARPASQHPRPGRLTTLISDWPTIRAALLRKLRRVERITDRDLVSWLLRRRPDLTEADAWVAVRLVLAGKGPLSD